MKFCLKDEYRYWWPVSVVLPHPTRPGVTETSSFEVEFRAISEDEVGEYRVKLEKMQPNEREKEGHGLILGAILNWRGVVDESGQEVPFSDSSLRQAFKSAPFRAGVYTAYQKSISGGAG